MNLDQFDGQCVRIIDCNGDAFDGFCSYNSAEYDAHEFGRDEESLQIESFLFFPGDIITVQCLEDHRGPYGRFLDPCGKLEELAADDGIDSIRDILFSEQRAHVMRMLNCLERYLDPVNGESLLCYHEVPEALSELLTLQPDRDIQEKAKRLLELWERSCR